MCLKLKLNCMQEYKYITFTVQKKEEEKMQQESGFLCAEITVPG